MAIMTVTDPETDEVKVLLTADGLVATDPACCCCPPAGAPTHVSISVNETITFEATCCAADCVIETSNSISAELDIDPGAWLQDSGFAPNIDFISCYQQLNAQSAGPFSFECPPEAEGCHSFGYQDRFLFFNVYLVFEGDNWYLWRADTDLGGSEETGFCGDSSDFNLFADESAPINLGPDPIGSHTFTLSGSGATATVTLVLS